MQTRAGPVPVSCLSGAHVMQTFCSKVAGSHHRQREGNDVEHLLADADVDAESGSLRN